MAVTFFPWTCIHLLTMIVLLLLVLVLFVFRQLFSIRESSIAATVMLADTFWY